MKNNAFASVGDTVVFNATGGYITGDYPTMGKEYRIVSLNQPYRTEGECNATLCSGGVVRLSTVHIGRSIGGYTDYFEVVNNYEIF